MLSCAEISGALAVASKSSPSESLRAEMLYKCGNLMLGCWRHYWGLLEATGIDLKVVGNTQSQYKASYQVDRLTGARTRRKLMIGAELGSSH
ncbi:hypothetical protein QL285_038802 [Trifolium repens]|nr:hypothetical protein QL285_075479 [Trifolium repens]KAK2416406.1 hypothetical protein QL285_038802 [Trifolium repens]